jgi:hypothetical protein
MVAICCSALRRPVVVTQQSTKTLSTLKPPALRRGWVCVNEYVAQTLVIPLAVIVRYKLPKGSTKVTVPQGNDPVQAFFLDRAHKTLSVRIAVWRVTRRSENAHTRPFEQPPNLRAPLAVSVTDEHSTITHNPVDLVRHLTMASQCARRKVSQDVGRSPVGRKDNPFVNPSGLPLVPRF